jgi:hypothetical protein
MEKNGEFNSENKSKEEADTNAEKENNKNAILESIKKREEGMNKEIEAAQAMKKDDLKQFIEISEGLEQFSNETIGKAAGLKNSDAEEINNQLESLREILKTKADEHITKYEANISQNIEKVRKDIEDYKNGQSNLALEEFTKALSDTEEYNKFFEKLLNGDPRSAKTEQLKEELTEIISEKNKTREDKNKKTKENKEGNQSESENKPPTVGETIAFVEKLDELRKAFGIEAGNEIIKLKELTSKNTEGMSEQEKLKYYETLSKIKSSHQTAQEGYNAALGISISERAADQFIDVLKNIKKNEAGSLQQHLSLLALAFTAEKGAVDLAMSGNRRELAGLSSERSSAVNRFSGAATNAWDLYHPHMKEESPEMKRLKGGLIWGNENEKPKREGVAFAGKKINMFRRIGDDWSIERFEKKQYGKIF